MRTAQQLLREALAWLDPRLNVSLCADIRQLLETPSVSAVAVVDADDNGLFVDIIYGKDGSALRQGDMLYAAPKPAVDGTVAMPEDWHKACLLYTSPSPRD